MHFERIADKKRLDFITGEIARASVPGSPVLDFGCGNGIIAHALAKMGYTVDAVDVSEKTIAAARAANPHSNIVYSVFSDDFWEQRQHHYTAIVCSEVLEHLHDPAALLKKLYNTLTATGILVVTVPNGYGPREILVTKPVQYLQTKNTLFSRAFFRLKKLLGYTGTTVQSSADDLSHLQFFSVDHLEKLASENGFRIETIKKSNFVEQVFPYSFLTKRSSLLQRLDCALADLLPLRFTSGFMSVWKKN